MASENNNCRHHRFRAGTRTQILQIPSFIYLAMFVGVCVCYRSLHCWGCGAEIWHGTGVPPEKVLANVQAAPPAAEAKECFWRSVQPEPTVRFREAALTRQKNQTAYYSKFKLLKHVFQRHPGQRRIIHIFCPSSSSASDYSCYLTSLTKNTTAKLGQAWSQIRDDWNL